MTLETRTVRKNIYLKKRIKRKMRKKTPTKLEKHNFLRYMRKTANTKDDKKQKDRKGLKN